MNNLSFVMTESAIMIVDGAKPTLIVGKDSPIYEKVVGLLETGTYEEVQKVIEEDKKQTIEALSYRSENICFQVSPDDMSLQVSYKDEDLKDLPIDITFKQRIIKTLMASKEKDFNFELKIFANFFDKLLQNPSFKVLQSLYSFLNVNNIPLTADGNFVAYKKIRYNYNDLHSNSMSNAIGNVVSMRRSAVEDDPNKTCSAGLHVCSKSYLKHYGFNSEESDRVVLVEVNPKDVVSIPNDYNNAKMRVCEYKVIDEITDFSVSLSPYIHGKHKDGWLKETMKKLEYIYKGFWNISEEDFDWTCIKIGPFDTQAIRKRFFVQIQKHFRIKINKNWIQSSSAGEYMRNPLKMLHLLSEKDTEALTS